MTGSDQLPGEETTLLPKPAHLGEAYASQFKDAAMVEAYGHRPEYPGEVFEILAGLIRDEPRTVLDIGCGRGEIARRLLPFAERVDAVDFSEDMLHAGRMLPDGGSPKLRWIHGAMEEAEIYPPYALVTAGASLHWMEWHVVLPRLGRALSPSGVLAIVGVSDGPNPWDSDLQAIINRYSTNREFERYDLIEELELRGLYSRLGERRTAPVRFIQSIESYVESFHARNGFSRERMLPEDAAAFDAAVTELVSIHCPDGLVELQITGNVVWGVPNGNQSAHQMQAPTH